MTRKLFSINLKFLREIAWWQNQVMSELKTRVEELKMENEYQLRLKDMNYNEKIKELTEKFIQVRKCLRNYFLAQTYFYSCH